MNFLAKPPKARRRDSARDNIIDLLWRRIHYGHGEETTGHRTCEDGDCLMVRLLLRENDVVLP